METPMDPAFQPYPCIGPMNEPTTYLGLKESTYRGITLTLHTSTYISDEGAESVAYSAIGPRQSADEPQVLLPKVEQWAPMARSDYNLVDTGFTGVCVHCSEEIPVGPAIYVNTLGLLHTACFSIPNPPASFLGKEYTVISV